MYNDKPEFIKFSHFDAINKDLVFIVSWKKRDDNYIPYDTYMSNNEIRKYDMNLLLDYYENKMKTSFLKHLETL